MFKPGDIVIGSTDPSKSVYSSTGAKLVENSFSLYGTEDQIEQIQNDLLVSVTRNGGKKIASLTSTSKKKTKKIKKPINKENLNFVTYENIQENEYDERSPVIELKEENHIIIQFENDFGKIKAKALHVSEHEQAFMLVFKNEEEVVFEPKVGEKLNIYINKYTSHSVYYPGVTFNSPFDNKRFMILFKVPQETTE